MKLPPFPNLLFRSTKKPPPFKKEMSSPDGLNTSSNLWRKSGFFFFFKRRGVEGSLAILFSSLLHCGFLWAFFPFAQKTSGFFAFVSKKVPPLPPLLHFNLILKLTPLLVLIHKILLFLCECASSFFFFTPPPFFFFDAVIPARPLFLVGSF